MAVSRHRGAYKRVDRFLRHELWSEALYLRWKKPHQRLFLHFLRDAYLLVGGVVFRDKLRLHAAALTFFSLLSIIPALAVVFSLFTAFGGLDDAKNQLRNFMIDLLAVSQREKVVGFVEGALSGVHAGAVGGVSTFALFLTAVALIANIERAFNAIWGVREERSFLRRFQRYWPVLTLGPLLIGISLSWTASVQASPFVQETIERLPLLGSAVSAGSMLFTILSFTIAYAVIPHTKVMPSAALVGGVVGGLLWEIAKYGYAIYAKEAISYSAIYGSLAFLPLTLVWIYVSWLLVLSGALVAFAYQNARTYKPEAEAPPPREQERIAATLLLAVHQRFAKGRGATSEEALIARAPGAPRAVHEAITELVSAGLLIATEVHENEQAIASYLPGRPAAKTCLADVHRILYGDPDAKPEQNDEKRDKPNEALAALDRAELAAMAELQAITIADLLEEESADRRTSTQDSPREPPIDPDVTRH